MQDAVFVAKPPAELRERLGVRVERFSRVPEQALLARPVRTFESLTSA